jgi:hypothetical protein
MVVTKSRKSKSIKSKKFRNKKTKKVGKLRGGAASSLTGLYQGPSAYGQYSKRSNIVEETSPQKNLSMPSLRQMTRGPNAMNLGFGNLKIRMPGMPMPMPNMTSLRQMSRGPNAMNLGIGNSKLYRGSSGTTIRGKTPTGSITIKGAKLSAKSFKPQ